MRRTCMYRVSYSSWFKHAASPAVSVLLTKQKFLSSSLTVVESTNNPPHYEPSLHCWSISPHRTVLGDMQMYPRSTKGAGGLTLRWWLCSAPVPLYPKSEPLSSCHPPECCEWRTPPRLCFCSRGWTHFVWTERAGCSSQHQSLQLTQLRREKEEKVSIQYVWGCNTSKCSCFMSHYAFTRILNMLNILKDLIPGPCFKHNM